MPVSYTCPNPDCGVTLKTPNPVAAGKSVKCPKCGQPFVPVPQEPTGPSTYALANDPVRRPAAPVAPPPPPPPKPFIDDDEEDAESIKRGYAVLKEDEEELKKIAKNKPKFTEVQDKFKKSARGPAQKLLVMPSNLLVFEGLITAVAGLGIFIWGMWPLVFNDAPPGEEETEEAVISMLLGLLVFGWGAAVCFGASQMQELGSYPIAMTGAIMGLVPLLVGVFAIIMLLNPKVKAGFEEVAGAIDEDEDEDKDKEDDDKEEDDEEEDDDDEERSKKKRRKKRVEEDDE
jgi:hypothetical protein